MVRGIAVSLVLLALPGVAQDDAGARKAERFMRDAKRQASRVKDLWKRFVFETDAMEDRELDKLVGAYEKAIDLYQRALEEQEQPGANAAILVLTRRVTQARFLQMQREFQRRGPEPTKPESTAPPKPQPKPAPKPKPEPGPKPEPKPAPMPKPEPKPEQGERAPQLPRVPDDPLPELEEPAAARRRGIQGVRDFVMNSYFAPRKLSSMLDRCTRCNGTGSVRTGRLKRNRAAETVTCGQCGGVGYLLIPNSARRGHWLVHSPLYRSDPAKAKEWQERLAAWKENPGKVPEFLTRVRITDVDYHGLWAEVVWTERGVTPDKKRFERKRKEKVIRAGRRWFFYDEKLDRHFFRGDEEPEGG